MTDDVLDAEVVSEETTFEPSPAALPFGKSLMGHCQDALDLEGLVDPREVARLHQGCPATVWPQEWPDPARKGATYTLPGRRCPCVCHTRPGTVTPGAT